MNSPRDFEILAVTIQLEGRPDIPVPLPPADTPEDDWSPPAPLVLKEGADFRVRLEFRVRSPEDLVGLKFVDERHRRGVPVAHQEIHLGDYRPGGPYEVVLPSERLPMGHVARDVYDATGTFLDGEGRVLGQERHSFEITKEWPHPH
ncbi:hypothetical protein [Streptomyces sp. NPDC000410]|uniref:hypothetical protein n=1 Tax=Streptomyces sp. NPDC000410 TaxID=3154254 RepID=UPI00331A7818